MAIATERIEEVMEFRDIFVEDVRVSEVCATDGDPWWRGVVSRSWWAQWPRQHPEYVRMRPAEEGVARLARAS